MGFRNVVNDGSSNTPRLRLQQSTWGLTKLPREGQEWSLPERLDQIAAAGFKGLEVFSGTDQLVEMLRDRGLALGVSTMAVQADDLLSPIELAHRHARRLSQRPGARIAEGLARKSPRFWKTCSIS